MYTLTITLTVPLNPTPHDFARALTEAAREADPEGAKIIRKLGEVVQTGIAYTLHKPPVWHMNNDGFDVLAWGARLRRRMRLQWHSPRAGA